MVAPNAPIRLVLALGFVLAAGFGTPRAAEAGIPQPLHLGGQPRGDVLVYNPAHGTWYNCLYDASAPERFAYVGGSWGPQWTVLPLRLTVDALADALLYNTQTGVWIWKVNSGSGYVNGPQGTWSPGWQLFQADFNGDGLDDVFVYNPENGRWYQCVNDGGSGFSYTSGPLFGTRRVIVIGDFNGDGRSDVFAYDQESGAWTEYLTAAGTGGGFDVTRAGTWSAGWTVVAGNLNEDALTDLFVYNATSGRWYQCYSTGDAAAFRYHGETWSPGWQVHPGDFNGDGATDLFVYNWTTGYWYVCLTRVGAGDGFSNYLAGRWSPQWEVGVTDFDDDGRADIFVYNRATGTHYQCLNTADGQFDYCPGRWSSGWLLATVVGSRLDAPPVPPSVHSISPASGPVDGGTVVSITGSYFMPGAAVWIGGMAAVAVRVVSSTLIEAITAPRIAGEADVVVSNPDGLQGVLPGGFTYARATVPPPVVRNILAFGDSITYGVTSMLTPDGFYQSPAPVVTGYPARLESLLRDRYSAYGVSVANAGVPGEYAVFGNARLSGLMADSFDLVVVLEGINDTNAVPSNDIIADALRAMVQTVREAGKPVVLCTLLPVLPSWPSGFYKANAFRVPDLNERIRAIAVEQGAVLVDLYEAFMPDPGPFLSPDGLHPNEAGYQRMAEVLAAAIDAAFLR